jgi:hypothetical protein
MRTHVQFRSAKFPSTNPDPDEIHDVTWFTSEQFRRGAT